MQYFLLTNYSKNVWLLSCYRIIWFFRFAVYFFVWPAKVLFQLANAEIFNVIPGKNSREKQESLNICMPANAKNSYCLTAPNLNLCKTKIHVLNYDFQFYFSKNFVGNIRLLVSPQADASTILSQTHGIFNQVRFISQLFGSYSSFIYYCVFVLSNPL